ncbi:uncharacterized protein N7482_006762 [Penicillium canariense]|uniref:Uncharacterized protein n=1 Tax=Penicillium canariense TaxID=189055 RepID=A0A9W9HVM4_9EURO|nr:uncharacterized protein N7482_006762 [Penicillium canariense]KAJ5159758.1 hypothetical protein N7482_006762 [Penicillium canariense]
MECLRQIFRCFKAPFTRDQGQIIEIGPPTNFRKEELPACFSDAESVLSPNQNATERPNLTTQPQHVDISEQRSNDGEGRDDDRDGRTRPSAVDQEENPESRQEDERQTDKPRLRDRMKPSRWFKSTAPNDPETEVASEDGLFTTAKERPKDH